MRNKEGEREKFSISFFISQVAPTPWTRTGRSQEPGGYSGILCGAVTQTHDQETGSEVEQRGHELVLPWDAGLAHSTFIRYSAALVPPTTSVLISIAEVEMLDIYISDSLTAIWNSLSFAIILKCLFHNG